MKIKCKYILVYIFCLVTLICYITPIQLLAGAKWASLGSGAQERARNLYAYLKLAGYSDYAAAGNCGNADQESGFSDEYNSGERSYYGYFQTNESTYHVWTALKNWASDNGLDYNDIVVQFKYIETVLENDFSTYASISLTDYKACSDIVTGTEGFMVAHERCVGGDYLPQKVKNKSDPNEKYQDGDIRIEYAEDLYTNLVGTPPADGSGSGEGGDGGNGQQTQEEAKEALMAKGYYSEDQLSAYIKLNETNIEQKYIDAAMRESLGQAELEGLSNWERNIKNGNHEDGIIAKLRIFTMFMGIALIVWSVLIYFSYWFDRINNFFDLDLLGILTMGKLHMSDTEEECTFKVKDLGKTEKKTVNHRAICAICLTGIFFGALIISGVLYKILQFLVYTILGLFGY